MELARIGCDGGYVSRLMLGRSRKRKLYRGRWGRMEAELGRGMVAGVGLGKQISCVWGLGILSTWDGGMSWGIARCQGPSAGPVHKVSRIWFQVRGFALFATRLSRRFGQRDEA